jgi:hypothetical protein
MPEPGAQPLLQLLLLLKLSSLPEEEEEGVREAERRPSDSSSYTKASSPP